MAVVHTCALLGLRGVPVTVEVDVANGLPGLHLVGLPDAVVREARERVRAAIRNSGLTYPNRRIIVNLAPSDLPKAGSGYDLPIAMGVLVATAQLPPLPEGAMFLGELALDGGVRHVDGVLCVADAARREGMAALYLAGEDAQEAALLAGLAVYGVPDLRRLADHLRGFDPMQAAPQDAFRPDQPVARTAIDLSEIGGQEQAKRTLELAAAGDHGLLLKGPPGVGKTILARALPSLLPLPSRQEALEVSKIYSIRGLLPRGQPLLWRRPFRSPHHTISEQALIGGGPRLLPGEVSLAHRGVLFLDELPEFRRPALEALRQPLEDRQVTISRVRGSLCYPASFLLVGTMNPCPCGYFGDDIHACRCTEGLLRAYRHRLSGPLLERIDLHVDLQRVALSELLGPGRAEGSEAVRRRVMGARQRQAARFARTWLRSNGDMGPAQVRRYCSLDGRGEAVLGHAARTQGLSARSLHRVLKVARTIADLDGADEIGDLHLAEAVLYRPRMEEGWLARA